MDFGTVVLYLYCSVISSLLSRSVTPISRRRQGSENNSCEGGCGGDCLLCVESGCGGEGLMFHSLLLPLVLTFYVGGRPTVSGGKSF